MNLLLVESVDVNVLEGKLVVQDWFCVLPYAFMYPSVELAASASHMVATRCLYSKLPEEFLNPAAFISRPWMEPLVSGDFSCQESSDKILGARGWSS